jgi:hypothetical protein
MKLKDIKFPRVKGVDMSKAKILVNDTFTIVLKTKEEELKSKAYRGSAPSKKSLIDEGAGLKEEKKEGIKYYNDAMI